MTGLVADQERGHTTIHIVNVLRVPNTLSIEMQSDRVESLHHNTLKSLPDDRIICDDEHGNSL